MFFSHLENRKDRHGDTAAGRWSSARFHDGVLDVIRGAGAFRGRVLEIGPGEHKTFEPSFVVVARRPEQGP